MNDWVGKVEFGFLGDRDVFGKGQHAYIREKGPKLEVTDLCIILGNASYDRPEIRGRKNLNAEACSYWAAFVKENKGVCVVSDEGLQGFEAPTARNICFRPASSSSKITKAPRTGVWGEGWCEVTYGSYPKNCPSVDIRQQLETDFKKGSIKKIEGASFTFDSVAVQDYKKKFNPKTYEVYEMDGKQYIRIVVKGLPIFGKKDLEFPLRGIRIVLKGLPMFAKGRLLDGTEIKNGSVCWVEVEPRRWAVDVRSVCPVAVSVEAMYSGVQYMDHGADCGDNYRNKRCYQFENEHFARDLMQESLNKAVVIESQDAVKEEKKVLKDIEADKVIESQNAVEEEKSPLTRRKNPYGLEFKKEITPEGVKVIQIDEEQLRKMSFKTHEIQSGREL